MGKTRYAALVEMINRIPEDVVHLESLKTYIRRNIATSERLVIETLKTMGQMGLIEEVSAFKYKLLRPKNGI